MNKTLLSLILVALIAAPLTAFGNVASVQAATFNTAIRGTTYSTVYWYANDGKRYVFPNAGTYNTWFPSFENVLTISDSELFSIPLAGNVTYRPGAKLVKVTSDPKTYAVARGGVLRHVTSESLASQLFGYDWASKVQDLPDEFFTNYTVGSPIYSTSDYNVSNEYNGVFSPSDSLRIQGQGSTSQSGSLTLNADRTSITSGQAVNLTGTYVGTLPSGGYLEIKDVRNSATIKTCTNTSTCNVTVNPMVDSTQNSVQYYIVAKNSNGTFIATQYGPVIYTNGSSQNGILSLTASRTSITNGQSVLLNAFIGDGNPSNLHSGERIEIREVRANTLVKTCYASTCEVTVYPYQSGYSSTQYVARIIDSNSNTAATQYSPTIFFDGSSINTFSLTADRTSVESGGSITLTANATQNLSNRYIIITNQTTGAVVGTCYNTSTCTKTATVIGSNGQSVRFNADYIDNSNGMVVDGGLVTISITSTGTGSTSNDGVNYINGLTLQSDRTTAANGDMVKLTANAFNVGNWSYVDNRIEIRDVRTGSIVKTCNDQSWCVVDTAVTGSNGTAQYEARIYDRLGRFVMSQFGPVITVSGTSTGSTSQTGSLVLSADRTSIRNGDSVLLSVNFNGTLLSNERIEIRNIQQSNERWSSTIKQCAAGTTSCSITEYPRPFYGTTVAGSNDQFDAVIVDISQTAIQAPIHPILRTSNRITVSFTDSTSGSSNDGTNYINGLTLQSDRTSAATGDMVKLTANASNAGNWSYIGNRIEIRDIRTGSIVRTCFDQSWCVVDLTVTGSNGTAQYEARIYDRTGSFIMSQFGPVIYVSGTSTGTGSVGTVAQIPNTDIYIAPTYNVRAGGTVYLTASFTNLPYTSTDTVIRLYTEQSSTPVGTCSGSVSCSVPYTIPTSGVNTRVYGVASNSALTNTRETARIPLYAF
ncbi:hypothetical protein K8R04_00225 [Candidatus Uhrbacteria bacterium]|nr:hypothetical protein [Candidatus Uhrbacteria bacterium]